MSTEGQERRILGEALKPESRRLRPLRGEAEGSTREDRYETWSSASLGLFRVGDLLKEIWAYPNRCDGTERIA